jgi:hypothetical protein
MRRASSKNIKTNLCDKKNITMANLGTETNTKNKPVRRRGYLKRIAINEPEFPLNFITEQITAPFY